MIWTLALFTGPGLFVCTSQLGLMTLWRLFIYSGWRSRSKVLSLLIWEASSLPDLWEARNIFNFLFYSIYFWHFFHVSVPVCNIHSPHTAVLVSLMTLIESDIAMDCIDNQVHRVCTVIYWERDGKNMLEKSRNDEELWSLCDIGNSQQSVGQYGIDIGMVSYQLIS